MSTLPSIADDASRLTDGVSNEERVQTQPPDVTARPPKPGPTLCGVCESNPSKYKCPRCYLPYCSVPCNKKHRENHPPDPEPTPTPAKPTISTTEPTTGAPRQVDPNNPFRILDTSDKLKLLFRKYPNLPNQLLQIHAATLPPSDTSSQTSGIPASLLKGLPKRETWNHDIGLQMGKDALRKAKRAEGEEGKAIREYSELILHILNTETPQADMTALLRQEVTQEDNKFIERLMAEEKR